MKKNIRNVIRRFGYIKSIIIITTVSILSSVAITFIFYKSFGQDVPQTTLLVSIIAPLLIASFISSYLVKVVMELYTIEAKLRRMTTHDELTGLLTRRNFLELADNYYSLAKRNNHVFSVVIMDLDHFKNINDTYGHLAGDEALRKIGDILNNSMRSSDFIGRFGGEEFICLLPETNADSALKYCDLLHNKINNAEIKYDGKNIPLTLSIGFTTYEPVHNKLQLNDLIKQADKALYGAKQEGRNRTIQFIHQSR